jgi:hypothetical protein
LEKGLSSNPKLGSSLFLSASKCVVGTKASGPVISPEIALSKLNPSRKSVSSFFLAEPFFFFIAWPQALV